MNQYNYRKIKWLRAIRQKFMHLAPRLYVTLSKLASKYILFKREREYLRGGLPSKSEQPSILYFGMNRAASMFLLESFERLAVAHDIEAVNLSRYFVHSDRRKVSQFANEEEAGKLFRPKGYFYGSLRDDVVLRDIDQYRGLAVIRDLRDVAVSYYYARREAHTLTDEKFIEWRERALSLTIDEHVPELAEEIAQQYGYFISLKNRSSNMMVMRYEDMMGDFGSWMSDVTNHLGLDQTPEIVEEIVSAATFTVSEENASSHRRSGKAGAYLKKLKPETVNLLNERYGDLLEAFGYEIEPSND
jgi:hypothetical protein